MHVHVKTLAAMAGLYFVIFQGAALQSRAAEPFISEFMPDNARILADEDGQFPDWIEIQNPGSQALDLAGYYLTDNAALLTRWRFPAVSVPAHGALVLFASGKNRTNVAGRLHANFQLDKDGGYLALVKPDGTTVVSSFQYPAVKEDVAYGIAQKQITTSLVATSAPEILVPMSAAGLPANWNAIGYAPGSEWTNGVAPPAVGFDTNQTAGTPANVAPGGTAAQSTTLSTFTANLGNDNNLGNFTHTTSADQSPFWQLTLTNQMAIFSIVLHNRTSCCGSRLRDITVEILSTNDTGTVTNWVSPLLNPENAGFTYPAGPANLTINLEQLTGGPILGQFVRVRRTPDPDLSGSGGQGNQDEMAVLSLGEVVVNASAAAGLRPYVRTDVQNLMMGQNASAFIRIPFTHGSVADTLTLRARYDDGFVAYLNGTEIARRNAPATLNWDAAATADRSFSESVAVEVLDISSAAAQLVPGANVLAVHLLNASALNGDALFEAEMIATRLESTTNVFLVDATPGVANDTAWYLDEVSDTRFSVDRGFFEAPFSLAITSSTPGALIYYSFNCDEPGPGKGTLYTGPITITNTTVLRARAVKENWRSSDVDTHTYLFLGDVVHQAKDWPVNRIPPPHFPASWGRNTVDYGMDPNVVANYTSAEWKEALTQIPTMSVVTEMPNLFDATTGIYANADGHGEDWERPASFELLDPTNAVPGRFQENGGLRIRGGFSRNPEFRKHSFRVFFRRDYGAGKLNYPLFENEGAQEFETFDLRTSQNYSWPRESSPANGTNDTMVREVWSRETLGAMGQPYRRSRYYHLYLNGQYWGLYETDERPEASYGQTYFGGSKTNFDVVKCGNRGTQPNFATEATDGNLIAFSNLWLICRAVAANPNNSNYFRVMGRNPDGTRDSNLPVMLDVENLIDYMIGIFYTGDGDATLSAFLSNNRPNNWFGMRDRTNPNVGFRFFNSDCEHTLGSPNSQVDRTGPFRDVSGSNIGNFLYANPQYFHEDLMWNAEYRQLFADRVQKHFFNNGALTFEQCTNRWWKRANQITKAMRAYSARWGDAVREPPYGELEWSNTVRAIALTWFPPRAGIVLAQLRADGLATAVAAPALSQNGGNVPAGYQLQMAHTNTTGVLYYTLDGSDPRAVGGGVSGSAQAYSGPITINGPTIVRARVLSGGVWSGIIEHVFYPPQDFSKLLVTEIMYHPPAVGLVDGDEYEFLELKNAGTTALNLSGLRFTAGITFTFTNGTVLAPGQFFVLVANPVRFAEKYPGVPVNGIYSGGLNNAGETLTLSHPLGGRVLSVAYADSAPWPITADAFGFSIVPVAPNENSDPDKATNWRASSHPGGSPGADDPQSAILPVLISEVLSHSELGSDFIELFNPNTVPVDVSGWFLTDAAGNPRKFRIPGGTTIAPLGFLLFNETHFNPTPGTNNSFSLNARGDDVYLFSGDANTNLTGFSHGFSFGAAPDGATFGRYVISTGEEQFPELVASSPGLPNPGPRVGPVVINEVMYHPDTGGDEFIEIKNISTNAVPLYDPAHPTNTWKIAGLGYTFPTNIVIGSNQLLLVVGMPPAQFRTKYGVPVDVMILGPYSGVLQDSGERLELQRPDVPDTNALAHIAVDVVRYNDRAPWPVAADGSGPSLQRKSSAAYGNDPANWEAAVATPGREFAGGQSPVILAQPQSQTVSRGATVVFNVAADGEAPLNYQWRFDGNNIPGATSSNLVIADAQLANAGNYSVFVFNQGGSAASAIAQLTVRTPPTIGMQPTNQSVRPGSNALFSVTATGNGLLRYQWQFNDVIIPTATNASLLVTNSQFSDEGLYSVIVSDGEGSTTSAAARLLILVDPIFIHSPVSQIVVTGATIVLSATVTNNATLPIGYRLRRNFTVLQDTLVVLNERTVYFTVTNLAGHTNYQVVATNAARLGGIVSGTALLTYVVDSDGDGLADTWEIQHGLNAESAADRNGDADGDGMLNWEEYEAGTDPTDGQSFLKIDTLAPGNGAILTFGAVSNRTYSVLSADAVGGPWTKLADVIAQTNSRIETIVDPAYTTNHFYRLRTPRQ